MFSPSDSERARCDLVMGRIREAVENGDTIRLPAFQGVGGGAETALQGLLLQESDFGGSLGPFGYQFEGEEDLLHLIVGRLDGRPIQVAEGQAVARFLLGDVGDGLVWIKPGRWTQHFYLAHDVLVESEESESLAPNP